MGRAPTLRRSARGRGQRPGRRRRGRSSTRRFGANLHVAVVTAKAEGTVIAPGTIHSYDVTIDNQNLLTLKLLEDEKAESRLAGRRPVGTAAPRPRLRARSAPDLRHAGRGAHRPVPRPRVVPAHQPRQPRGDGLPRRHRQGQPNATSPAARSSSSSPATRSTPTTSATACSARSTRSASELLGFTETLPIDNNDVDVDTTKFPADAPAALVREIGALHDQRRHQPPALVRRVRRPAPVVVEPASVASARPARSRVRRRRRQVDGQPPPGLGGRIRRSHDHDESDDEGGRSAKAAPAQARLPRRDRRTSRSSPPPSRGSPGPSPTSPTYMIFDDHEVTDDWYLSQSWRSRVVTAPFGRAVAAQRLHGLRGLPGVGQRPGAVQPRRRAAPKPKNEELLDALAGGRHRRADQPARRSASWTSSSASIDAGQGPAGHLPLRACPGPTPPRPRPRHADPAHVQGPTRAAASCSAAASTRSSPPDR